MHPHKWTNHPDRPLGGPTIVCDLDGVISDASHRQHFLQAERSRDRDWTGFFHACVDDPVIEVGRRLIASFDDGYCVIILTARIFDIREQTVAWLGANEIRHDWLALRGPREGQESPSWKREQLLAFRSAGCEIELFIDDDPRNVDMAKGLDIPALYVPSGYYDSRDSASPEHR